MQLVMRAGNDVRNAHRLEEHRHHDVGLHIGADGHHGDVHVIDAQFPEDGFTRGVTGDRVGNLAHKGLHASLVLVDRHYIVAELVKGARYARSKPAQAYYRNLFLGCSDEKSPDSCLAELSAGSRPETIIRFRVSVSVYPLLATGPARVTPG